jgi:hypothetical protein
MTEPYAHTGTPDTERGSMTERVASDTGIVNVTGIVDAAGERWVYRRTSSTMPSLPVPIRRLPPRLPRQERRYEGTDQG